MNTNPAVLRFTGDESFHSFSDATILLLNYSTYKSTGYGRWAVIQKSTNSFVGWCGLKHHTNHNYTDLGFRFFERYWNQGFATETAIAVIEYAFRTLLLPKLVARVEVGNSPSIRVLTKIGFEKNEEISFNVTPGFLYILKSRSLSL